MNKIWLVIQREYLTRVRNKTFILSTILTPIGFVAIIAAVVLITVKNVRQEKVAVVDGQGILKSNLEGSKSVMYDFATGVDTSNFTAKGYSAILLAPNSGSNNTPNFKLITEKSLSSIANNRIEDDISSALENNMISQELKVDPKRIDSIKNRAGAVALETNKRGEDGGITKSNFSVASSLGYVTAFLIYIMMIVYGTMVMRGVMEEKTNRIAEVVISSVKPFQLMIGKIVGIGAVGLTQFLIWIILIGVISAVATSFISPDVLEQMEQSQQGMTGSTAQTSESIKTLANAQLMLSNINWPLVIGAFLFYFFGGYLFYAALFAAVGSAVNEDANDAQSLTFPIMLPIILAIIIMINSINDPSSTLATWASIIPFTSPVVMMSRIPFGVPDTVPYWELALSVAFLIAGFLATTWLSAKVYRTGILLYGKKPTWKEMVKWIAR